MQLQWWNMYPVTWYENGNTMIGGPAIPFMTGRYLAGRTSGRLWVQ